MISDWPPDEERAKQEEAAQESLQQKIDRLDCTLESIATRFSRLLAEYSSFQIRVKQRLAKLEASPGLDPAPGSVPSSGPSSGPGSGPGSHFLPDPD